MSAICAALLAAACSKQASAPPPAQPDPPASQSSAVHAPGALHAWLGQWDGPEGTYLQLIEKPESRYELIIKNLDGERSFNGVGSTDHVTFERDGKQETISATDGAATGMKWLAGKSRCLTIRPGEGYCRE
ncbi:MAG: hypothetical protein ABIR94_01160 [Rubrivivax sp.]